MLTLGFSFGCCSVVHIIYRVWGLQLGCQALFIENEVVSSAMDGITDKLGVEDLKLRVSFGYCFGVHIIYRTWGFQLGCQNPLY